MAGKGDKVAQGYRTKQWEESPFREKIRSKRKKRKYKERLAIKK